MSGMWIERYMTFEAQLRIRLRDGFETYGDVSFKTPLMASLSELEKEALDLTGWGYILWCKLQDIKEKVTDFEKAIIETKDKAAGSADPTPVV